MIKNFMVNNDAKVIEVTMLPNDLYQAIEKSRSTGKVQYHKIYLGHHF